MSKTEKSLILISIILSFISLVIFFLFIFKPLVSKGDNFYLSYTLNTDNLYLGWNSPLLTINKNLEDVVVKVEEIYEGEVEEWLENNTIEISDGVYVGRECSNLKFYFDSWDDNLIQILETKYDGCK